MDQDSVDRILSATFPLARRGYDRHEVERFLNEIADWLETGGTDEARADLVGEDLDKIGKQVSNILTEAHDAARTMRAEAEREVRQQLLDANRKAEAIRESAEQHATETREEADAVLMKTRSEANAQADEVQAEADSYAQTTRGDADSYSEKVRSEAEAAVRELRAKTEKAAKELTDKARAEARRIVDEANGKRVEVEKVIGDLEQRRQSVVDELRRLASDVAGAAGTPPPESKPAAKAKSSNGDGTEKTAERPAASKAGAAASGEGSSSK